MQIRLLKIHWVKAYDKSCSMFYRGHFGRMTSSMWSFLFSIFLLQVCRSTSKLQLIVSESDENVVSHYYDNLTSSALIDDLWATCHTDCTQGEFRILDWSIQEIVKLGRLPLKKVFMDSKDAGRTTIKLGLEALSKTLAVFRNDLLSSDPASFQYKAEILMDLLKFNSFLLYKYTSLEQIVRDASLKMKSSADILTQFNLPTWMLEGNAEFINTVHLSFLFNAPIVGLTVPTEAIEMRAFFQGLVRSWTCFHAALLATTKSGHVNAEILRSPVWNFEICHYFYFFNFIMGNITNRRTIGEYVTILNEERICYEEAINDVSFLKSKSSTFQKFFVDLMKRYKMMEVLALIDKDTDD